MVMGRRCSGTQHDGRACGAWAMRGESSRLWHSIDRADEATAARRLGGLRRRRERTLAGAYEIDGLGDVAAIRRLLEIAVLDALGRTTPSPVPGCSSVPPWRPPSCSRQASWRSASRPWRQRSVQRCRAMWRASGCSSSRWERARDQRTARRPARGWPAAAAGVPAVARGGAALRVAPPLRHLAHRPARGDGTPGAGARGCRDRGHPGMRGRPHQAVDRAVRVAIRDAVSLVQLVIELNIAARTTIEREGPAFALPAAQLRALVQETHATDAASARAPASGLARRALAWRTSMAAHLGAIRDAAAARASVEARYLDGTRCLFPDAVDEWIGRTVLAWRRAWG